MRKPTIVLITLLFLSNLIFGQNKEVDNFWYTASYEMTKDLFKKSNNFYKIKKLDIDKTLIKPTSSTEEILRAINFLNNNGKLLLEKDQTKYLVFESELPEVFKTEKNEVYTFNLVKNNLQFENGSSLNLMDANSLSIGLNFSYRSQIESETNLEDKLSGTIVYQAKFISDYATKTISKKEIGTQFELNDKKYLIVDIFDNKLVIKPLSKELLDLESINLKTIVLDDKGENEFVSFSYNELETLEKTNPKYKGAKSFSSSVSLINENMYNEFKKDSGVNLEQFKKMISLEELKDPSLTGKYIIYELLAPIENDIIIYEPIYGISKTIEIKL